MPSQHLDQVGLFIFITTMISMHRMSTHHCLRGQLGTVVSVATQVLAAFQDSADILAQAEYLDSVVTRELADSVVILGCRDSAATQE